MLSVYVLNKRATPPSSPANVRACDEGVLDLASQRASRCRYYSVS